MELQDEGFTCAFDANEVGSGASGESPQIVSVSDTKPVNDNMSDPSYILCPVDQLKQYPPNELNKIFAEASTKFNIKPASAREFLVAKKVIQGSPEDMAQFIFDQTKLSKRRIGEYIGKHDSFNQKVCLSLIYKYKFASIPLDDALRLLMKQFRLPGEAQQIDRILEMFAKSYHDQNPGVFASHDTAHILSFSVMMLNTDLHNQSIAAQKKMSVQEFVRNNRGINKGADLPSDLLESLYNRIKSNEIRMSDKDQYESDVVTFMAPIKSGWVGKKSDSFIPQWKKRWFVLNDGCLYYFSNPSEEIPRGIIPLDNTRVGHGGTKKEFIITSANGAVVKSSKVLSGHMEQGRRQKYILQAETEEERDDWVQTLQEETMQFLPLQVFVF